ncbi:MAG: alpha/beta hydrolase family protein [Gammaproteobacteria bacterium]|nr:alpha/beta hydrolase family protein [Gammaproteobacteria bacterium]
MTARFSNLTIALFMLMSLAWNTAWAAPDYEREKRLAAEFVDAIVVGDVVDLNDGERDFVGIMTDAEGEKARGAVLILHGRGYHPAWPTVVQPLRTALPESDWATLSIQMPVLDKEAKYFDYVPLFPDAYGRIRASIKYLRDEGYERVVVLAHSCGAHMAMSYFNQHTDKEIDAYIGIGQGATDYKQPMVEHLPFDGMKVPILDIYGANDFPAVLRMAGERNKLIQKAGNPKSLQTVVEGADHYYQKSGDVDKLAEKIIAWLNTL